MNWIVERSITELQEMMTGGACTARQVSAAYLERIGALDPLVRSVVELNPDAIDIADELDSERRAGGVRGPLHGIPILLKENIDTDDKMLTTAGSLALMDSMPTRDSTTAMRLRDAGAVILGKTAMSEWAFYRSTSGTSGWSARNGQVRNPHALDRTPGGSSSGSGVAAAASFAAATIGTETDGSIMSPSSANGVVGIKPTVGLTSRDGVIPISRSQDTVGPIARTVADAVAVLSALTGVEYDDFVDSAGLAGARIGVARNLFGKSAPTHTIMEGSLERLTAAGATLIDTELGHIGEIRRCEKVILAYEFKADVELYLRTRSPGSSKSLADLIEFNLANADEELTFFGQELFEWSQAMGPLTDSVYLEALATGQRLARAEGIDKALDQHGLDAIVAPTAAPAPLIDLINGERFIVGSATHAAVAGYPLMTVPAGHAFGLPVGITFMGRAASEPTLIKLASGFEAITAARRPPTFVPSIREGWEPPDNCDLSSRATS